MARLQPSRECTLLFISSHASASCLGDGHYGSCNCLCVRSAGITEVLELTSLGCRRQMHKWDFVLEALEFVPCLGQIYKKGGRGERGGGGWCRLRWWWLGEVAGGEGGRLSDAPPPK